MNKPCALLVLTLALLTASCDLIPPEPPKPLTLPVKLYEREFEGHRLTVTLRARPDAPGGYAFLMEARIAEGKNKFGAYIIMVPLTEGYQKGASVDWNQRIGDQKGSGSLWEKPDASASAGAAEVAFGLGASATYPVAVFVRVKAVRMDDPGVTKEKEETHGPVAVLQILPDGQGVARLDQP